MKEQRTEGGRVHNEKHWLTLLHEVDHFKPFEHKLTFY
jgi:hypothetical protein